uniref:ABC transporter ATP-binding protein n=2 Tax=candidate division WOR-3 bacterium TaxID=2052148 RepID=A0A7V4E502_UNCW3
MKEYFRMLRFVKKNLVSFVVAFLLLSISSMLNGFSLGIISPVLRMLFYKENAPLYSEKKLPVVGKIFNRFILQVPPLEAVRNLALLIVVFYLMKAIVTYFQKLSGVYVEEKVVKDLREALFKKILSLPLSFFHKKSSGEVISHFINDINLLKTSITHGVYVLISETATLTAYLILAFLASWHLTLFALLVIPATLLVITAVSRRLRKRSKVSQEKMGNIATVLYETLTGIKVIKSFGTEKKEEERFNKSSKDYFKSVLRFHYLGALASPLTEFLTMTVAAMLLVYGGILIFKLQILTPDRFFVFLAAALTMISPLKHLSQINVYLQEGAAASKRLLEIFDLPEYKWEGKIPFEGIKEKIELRNVTFSYPKAGFTLKGINLEIKKGEKVAIVGPTGAGKTTLVDIILGFYKVEVGEILIDGVSLYEYDYDSFRAKVAVVPQEVILFGGTIRDNLVYAAGDVTEEDLRDICRKTKVEEIYERFPDGLNAKVGERGITLSGGERQRIALARALLRKPSILVLDEATSALDSETEEAIKEALAEITKDTTVITIAHRLATVLSSDKIVVLDEGEVLAVGKHNELYRSCELYKRLFDAQFQYTL